MAIEAHNYYTIGCSYLETEQYDSALLSFAKASRLNPDYPLLRSRIALTFMNLGDRTSAMALAEGLVRSSPKDANAWLTLGEIAWICQMWERAFPAATRAFELDSATKENMFLYALMLGDFGRLKEHRELLERLVAQHPKYLHPRLDLAKVELLDGDYTQGWKNFEARFWSLTKIYKTGI